ncbi:hypothetical protein M3221_21045 [Domibacillus indicus]|uniref:hypothetical protein n=1 Tax=Domibacillus indicus TaxID=1437523 RepID=UPI00203C71FC|nr:hypothetical protein [Domibacillus indicus]MCM3790837.1 hypothetical protein [Domibacillus indicus]
MAHNRLRSNDMNVAHDMALVEHFRAAIGMKTFILTPSYPFMFVGEIVSMVGDQVEIFAETTHFCSTGKTKLADPCP